MRREAITNADAGGELKKFASGQQFSTILADPPWRFQNSTGKVAPEHRRLNRYGTLLLDDIKALPVAGIAAPTSHLYLWVPNALLAEGLAVMAAWGFTYKSNIVWHKITSPILSGTKSVRTVGPMGAVSASIFGT